VRKDTDLEKQITTTQLVKLSQDDRVNEIARMLGGVDITSNTLAHATEMLGL